MNQVECQALRDMLFASRFSTEHKERVFRYLAVEPGGVGDAVATVHYAYAPAVWDRAGCNADADSYLTALIEQTPYKDAPLALQYHDYLGHGWTLGWDQTAKDSHNDFPTLVLRETADGQVVGALMRDPHDAGDATVAIAAAYAELEEVDQLLQQLEGLERHAKFMGLYQDSAIRAESLDAAIAQTPASAAGQKAVLLYRNMEWWRGLWTQDDEADIHLSSVADFHGIRVSDAKRQTRGGLDSVRNQATIPGDYAILEQAIKLLPLDEVIAADDYEALPAIKALCDWWNGHAPEAMRLAGVFRLYCWDETERMFHPGDPEEPAVSAAQMEEAQCYALFEAAGKPTVVAKFYRGRAYNREDSWGTQTFLANGEPGWKIGLDPSEVNEAYYSFIGLRNLRSIWQRQNAAETAEGTSPFVVWCGDKLFASVDTTPVDEFTEGWASLTLEQVIAAGVRALLLEAGLAEHLAAERGQDAAADFGREYQALSLAANNYAFHISRLLDTESTLTMPWNASRKVTLQAVAHYLEKIRVCRDPEGHALAEAALGDLTAPKEGRVLPEPDAPACKSSGDGALVARRLMSDLAHHVFMHCTEHDAVFCWGVQIGILEEQLYRAAPDFDRLDALLTSLASKLSDDEDDMLWQLTDPQDTLPNLRDAVADLRYAVAVWRDSGTVQIDRITPSGRRAALGEGSFRDQRFTALF